MNLEQEWNNIAAEDKDLSAIIKKGIPKMASKDPLQKIKQNLFTNALLGFAICVAYIFIIIDFPVWQVFVCIGIVLLFTIWASVKALFLFTQLNRNITNNSLLQQMELYYTSIEKWVGLQQQVGLLIYPVAAAGGFMIGGSLGAGKTIDEVMHKPIMIIAMIVVTTLLVPLCFYLAKWMCKKAFGRYINQLKENIETLKNE